ncbi:hypothetical protein YSY43_00250 [Paenibacillus sp. YSY-4.3]
MERPFWYLKMCGVIPNGFLVMFTLYPEVENNEFYAGASTEGRWYFSGNF